MMHIARIAVAPPDRKGATEENAIRIRPVEGDEALGYTGSGHEEHSGEPVAELANAPPPHSLPSKRVA